MRLDTTRKVTTTKNELNKIVNRNNDDNLTRLLQAHSRCVDSLIQQASLPLAVQSLQRFHVLFGQTEVKDL